mgnify:FL=1
MTTEQRLKAEEYGYSNLFANKTPQEMQDYIAQLSGSERALAFAIYGMTVNMMATLIVTNGFKE